MFATGTTSHTPFIPIILGNIDIPIIKNTNVLSNDSIADIFPLEYAVNIPDANIPIPENMNDIENILNPFDVISNSSLPLLANNPINVSDNIIEVINTIIPNTPTIIKLYFSNL